MMSMITGYVRTDNIAIGEFRPCNKDSVSILDVLGVYLCARAILDRVPVADLVRSERVSRRWQRVVCDYLQTCSFNYYDSMHNSLYCKNDFKHRDIVMPYTNRRPQLIRKTLEKWGSCIVKVIIDNIDRGVYDYIDIIAYTCPYLQFIQFNNDQFCRLNGMSIANYINCVELKHLSFNAFPRNFDDVCFVKLFKNLDCEKLEMSHKNGIRGSFLNSYKLNNLKSLTLNRCFALHPSILCSNAYKLRNLTILILNDIDNSIFKYLHILLNSTPKLEHLSLCNYKPTVLNDKVIASFSRLDLRSVYLVRNASVNSALLEALAQGSSMLERVDLTGVRAGCGRGVAALCRRPLVTLALGYIRKNMTYFNACRFYFLKHTRRIPVIGELEALGCVEFTRQWLMDSWHTSPGRDTPLELTLRHTGVEPQRELKIILADNFIDQLPMQF